MQISTEPSTNYGYLIPSSIITLFLLFTISLYFCKYHRHCPQILWILILLLINQFFESVFQILEYIEGISNIGCVVGLLGRTAFTLAANYWVIFIMRLIYLETQSPGKYLHLQKYISRNICFTYLPSFFVCCFLVIAVNISDTDSEKLCWRIIVNKTFWDYAIYITSFLLPNLFALLLVLYFLGGYCRLTNKIRNIYLLYPLSSLLFNTYYLVIKIYCFVYENVELSSFEVPFIFEPLVYGIIFLVVLNRNIKMMSNYSSDYTIKDQSNSGSFIKRSNEGIDGSTLDQKLEG